MYRNMVEMLQARYEEEKGLTFILSDREEKTVLYRDLYTTARGILHGLKARGMKPGDELILQLDNNEAFLYAFWAGVLGKIISVPITAGSQEEHKWKVFRIWDVLNSPYLITNRKRLDSIKSFALEQGLDEQMAVLEARTILIEDVLEYSELADVEDPDPEEIAFIQFSSGSTGDPKGVVLTHRNLITNLNSIAIGIGAKPTEKTLSWLPLTHDMGMIGMHLTPVFASFHQYHMDPSMFVRRPVLWIKKANQHQATYLCGPNFGYKFFVQAFSPEMGEGWDLSSVKIMFNGSEPIVADVVRLFCETLKPFGLSPNAVFDVYGLAEASLAVTFPQIGEGLHSLIVDRETLGVGKSICEVERSSKQAFEVVSLGRPIVDTYVRICDESGQEVADNVIGFVEIKGDNVTAGYYNNPEATAKLIREDGWLNTGDLGFLREGQLYLTGRAKDIIFFQGKNYYPHDIERIVADVEGVSRGEVGACGVYNDELQREEIHLFVMFKKEASAFGPVILEMRRRLSEQLGLAVQDILPVKHLPKTTSGKIQRYQLAEAYRNGEFNDLIAEVRALIQPEELPENELTGSQTERTLLKIAREVIGVAEIGLNDNFTKYGVTSLQMTQMHERLEKVFPGRLKVSDLFAFPSIAMLADFVEGRGQIMLSAVQMPQDFFASRTTGKRRLAFDVQFDREAEESLETISTTEQVAETDLLLALTANLLSQVSGNSLVTVQSMIASDESLLPVTVDFDQVEDLSELFAWVKQSARSFDRETAYAVKDLDKVIANRDPQAVVPLFCDRDLKRGVQGVSQAFDLVFEFYREGAGAGVYVEFNSHRLQPERVKQLATDLVKLVKRLGQAFTSSGGRG